MSRISPPRILLLAIAGIGFAFAAEASAQSAPAPTTAVPAAPSAVPGMSDPSVATVAVPARGLDMDQVEQRFGVAETKLPAVGNPPITRWVYRDFTVYFEGRYVIHAVVNQ